MRAGLARARPDGGSAHLGDDPPQHGAVDRLDQVVVEAGGGRAVQVLLLSVARSPPPARRVRAPPRAAAPRPRSRPCPAARCRAAPARAASAAAAASAPGPSWASVTRWPLSSSTCFIACAASTLSSTTSTRSGATGRRSLTGARRRAPPAPSSRAPSGSRTTNSLPRPGPSLNACTDPPCILTSVRTIVRPMPSPPWARSNDRVSCTNRSKARASSSGDHPRAVVADPDDRLAALRPRTTSVMCPPTSVYLAALLSRFANTWTRRVGIGVERHRLVAPASARAAAASRPSAGG